VRTSDVDRIRAFSRAFQELNARISIFVNLRLEALDNFSLQRELDRIGTFDVTPAE